MPISPHAKLERRYFRPSKDAMPLPELITVQKTSFNWFLKEGFKELFDEVSPIKDFTGRDLELYFYDYYLDEPRFDEKTAKNKNLTFEAALRVNTALVNQRTGEVKEQEVYLGDFPLMTNRGTFIVNGIERVVISQLIRSAGVFFSSENVKGKKHYGAKIIPNRGAWLELETDSNNVIIVKIDRKRKVPITSLLRAFGFSRDEEILELFKDVDTGDIKYIEETIAKDPAKTEAEGLKEVYKRIRPGDLATADNAKSLIYSMFFKFERYDFEKVGRYKLNARFGENLPINKETRILRREDLINIIKEIISLNNSQKDADDIDHLGNRRVRAVGELIQNKFRIGLARMERIVKDRMSTKDLDALTPGKLINARPVIASVREFFMSSQLSQFMDQINPLAELVHKRRLSAMGPGGLSRERAGFEVRDVHRTHYGRICPIATPEGPNIGLVGHMASYARINQYGFIETPYRKVISELPKKSKDLEGKITRGEIVDPKSEKVLVADGVKIDKNLAAIFAKATLEKIPVKPYVTNEIEYIDAFKEERSVTCSAVTEVDEDGYFANEREAVRKYSQPDIGYIHEIDYMDVSPKQIISISTSLIPFIEHDDASRALMGTNMQRQAVPCVRPDSPYIGTGVEKKAAYDSGHVAIAEADGIITKISGNLIELTGNDKKKYTYELNKFNRSNASTCLNQKPTVEIRQKVKKGDPISDGASISHSELGLGQNVLVAYMPWEGGNYEDAVLISDILAHESDKYTSIHIEDYVMEVRDTKLGPEVITRDIPNVSEEKLKNLDEEGVIRVGAEVKSGDILVGKITPKGETELSAEEKLLRAIFGDKAKDVKDSSLYLEHGEHGKVVDIKIFTKENGDKLSAGVTRAIQISVAQLRKIQVGDKVAGRHGNKGVISRIVSREDMPFLEDGTPIDIILNPLGIASRMNLGQVLELHLGLAAKKLGYKVATPAFNGVTEPMIKKELIKAGYPDNGKLTMFDGRTGLPFKEKVSCGISYILKLNHLVEDKIHQRSIGPYSLVTQQPLGGKAQFGGQRFGEMEVWAVEAYGAANILQEILTIKSDDVNGRSKAYEAVIKGEPISRVHAPEAFNVLVRELKGLCLDVELMGTPEAGFEEKKEIEGEGSADAKAMADKE